MKIMGLDVGDRRIGIATCDPLEIVASPREVVMRNGRELEFLECFVRDEEIERVVVGMPYDEEGQIGPQARKVQTLLNQLRERLSVPVVEWDEHLSTWEAESVLIDAGRTRAERRRVVDKLAAAVILRSYLDRRREKSVE
jgi:putative holliday junction resolvase